MSLLYLIGGVMVFAAGRISRSRVVGPIALLEDGGGSSRFEA